ncbi:hypothetical protein [Actinoplanes sp. NPDC049316]|uniref:hypothetical protein n=1 Tax=Actinoplanes sp. NPDC049316 TaxID=3154727 RepID=UPI00342FB5F5
MQDGRGTGGVGRRSPLPMLALLTVLMIAVSTGRAIGLCIVFRLTRRAVPGCVPAWSADRAPPRRAAAA